MTSMGPGADGTGCVGRWPPSQVAQLCQARRTRCVGRPPGHRRAPRGERVEHHRDGPLAHVKGHECATADGPPAGRLLAGAGIWVTSSCSEQSSVSCLGPTLPVLTAPGGADSEQTQQAHGERLPGRLRPALGCLRAWLGQVRCPLLVSEAPPTAIPSTSGLPTSGTRWSASQCHPRAAIWSQFLRWLRALPSRLPPCGSVLRWYFTPLVPPTGRPTSGESSAAPGAFMGRPVVAQQCQRDDCGAPAPLSSSSSSTSPPMRGHCVRPGRSALPAVCTGRYKR